MSSAKEELIKVIEGQSDDSTLEEIVRELTVLRHDPAGIG